jgi:hypothetical protein
MGITKLNELTNTFPALVDKDVFTKLLALPDITANNTLAQL